MNETTDVRQRIEQEAKDSMIPASELVTSFDARVWAQEFKKDCRQMQVGW